MEHVPALNWPSNLYASTAPLLGKRFCRCGCQAQANTSELIEGVVEWFANRRCLIRYKADRIRG